MHALPNPWPVLTAVDGLSSVAAGARPTADAQALDIVFVEGFVGHTVIGIHASELHEPQPLVVDLQAGVPRARACDTDFIGDTIDYAEVRTRLQRLFVEHRVQLLEALAERIADILLHEFRAHWVRVRVAKPRKFDDVLGVGVMIERRRTLPLEPVAGERAERVGRPGCEAAGASERAGHSAAVIQLLGSGMVPGGH
jgi:dihydroneopterin aldolase